jgi:class 3 adenylate cyclase
VNTTGHAEDRSPGVSPVRPYLVPVSHSPKYPSVQRLSTTPLYRTIVGIDIEGSTARTNPTKARLRQSMYDLLEEALRVTGIAKQHRDPLVDRGDGVLVLIQPSDRVPKTLLLDTFFPAFHRLLIHHNAKHADDAYRVRAAVHAGEVHFDRHGPFGEAVDVTCRLLDEPGLKIILRNTAAPLALVVSDDIYRSVVKHGYAGVDRRSFEYALHLRIAGQWRTGWVAVGSHGA